MTLTFEQLAQQYIGLSDPRWGAHAAGTAKSVVRTHLIAKLGHLTVEKLHAKEIQAFLDDLVRNNASASLLQKVVEHLRGILDLAQESGVLRVNPMRSRTSKISYRSRPASQRHLTVEECGALLSELAGRDLLIVRMFIQLGLRPKELFALRRDDLKGSFLRIDEVLINGRVTNVGTENSPFGVYVPPDLLSRIGDWMQSNSGQEGDWLFPASRRSRGCANLPPLSQHLFRSRVVRKAGEKAGVPDIDLLAFRRTCASFFAHEATARDTLAQMRHYNVESAGESDSQAVPSSLQRVADKIEAQILKAANQMEKAKTARIYQQTLQLPAPNPAAN